MFEILSSDVQEKAEEVQCSHCGSRDIEELPSWIPMSFNLNLYFGLMSWQYSCQQCKTVFDLPVPTGPTEEKERKCPTCGSMQIERLTPLEVDLPIYCG
jgi:DNA-directed RNA polymerase subunit RPC12/RpoP